MNLTVYYHLDWAMMMIKRMINFELIVDSVVDQLNQLIYHLKSTYGFIIVIVTLLTIN